jgi:hypothetical protein
MKISAIAATVAVAALALTGCSATGKTAAPSQATSSDAMTVNDQPVSKAAACATFVGKILTKADENVICIEPDGTISPAGATTCTNGLIYISLSNVVGGIEGQHAVAASTAPILDRETCAVS